MEVQTLKYPSPSLNNVCSVPVQYPFHGNSTWKGFNINCPEWLSEKNGVNMAMRNHPSVNDAKYWIVTVIVFIALRRLLFERLIFRPFGKRLGLGASCSKPTSCKNPASAANLLLEQAYSNHKRWSEKDIWNLSKQTGLQSREIERWRRKRKVITKGSSKLTKFCETGWRLSCYIISTVIGIWALWDKSWIWDFSQCWTDLPKQEIPNEVRWYYLYGAGLYGSCLLTQAFDVRRKDFKEMFLHHVVTIGLIVSSWILNMTRYGSIVLLLHDCGDVFLEAAKLAKYAKRNDLAEGIFVVFIVVWTVTRLIIFPTTILKAMETQSTKVVLHPVYYYPIITMMISLFCLHLFWTYFIVKTIIAVLNRDTKQTRDHRSSTDSSSEDSPLSHEEID